MSNESVISEFAEITGTDRDNARKYLAEHGWSLEVALTSFYDTSPSLTVESGGLISSDSDESVTIEPDEREKPKEKPKEKPSSAKNRIGTLASILVRDSDSDDENRQAFYAGGSEHSGQQVLGSDRRTGRDEDSNRTREFITRLLHDAHEHGEISDDSVTHHRAFSGVGYRLGQTSDDSSVVMGDGPRKSGANRREVVLKMWREGFSVDDGPLREYTNPENVTFLNDIRHGRIPDEFLADAQEGTVGVSMEDHSHEKYVTPKNKVKAFSGQGHMLGSPAPVFGNNADMKTSCDTSKKSDDYENENGAFTVDNSQPTTTIQVRLSDGSCLQAVLNHFHTIRDLRAFIKLARPQYVGVPFSLVTSYPSRELSNDDITLEEAGILSSAILQRLK